VKQQSCYTVTRALYTIKVKTRMMMAEKSGLQTKRPSKAAFKHQQNLSQPINCIECK